MELPSTLLKLAAVVVVRSFAVSAVPTPAVDPKKAIS
jgi:hypothetical protein